MCCILRGRGADLVVQVRYWKMYIEQELKVKNFPLVEQLFGRCLLACPNVEIWRLCTSPLRCSRRRSSPRSDLNYVRSPKEGVVQGRDEVIKAFEFALEHIGMDITSSPIWTDYIAFLKADEVRCYRVCA